MNLNLSDGRMYKIRTARKHFLLTQAMKHTIFKNTTWAKYELKSQDPQLDGCPFLQLASTNRPNRVGEGVDDLR